MRRTLYLPALCASAVLANSVHAELSASMGIANLYLFRGLNMSQGSPLVAGALDYTHSNGLYAGIWSASGDDKAGVEVDYYLGFNGQLRDLGYQLQYLNYYYPNSQGSATAVVDIEDYAELSLALSFLGIDVGAVTPTRSSAAGEYVYYHLSYAYQKISATLGVNAHEQAAARYSHADLKFQLNQNMSFVVSQVLDQGHASTLPDATLWQVNYHLPIDL